VQPVEERLLRGRHSGGEKEQAQEREKDRIGISEAECIQSKKSWLPFFLMYMVGLYVAGLTRKYIGNNVDVKINLGNTKSKKDRRIESRSLQETVRDMMEQLIA
jgi:hypothetical protein